MKRLLILSIVLLAVIANGGQREDYPGQSHHGEPPKGWACTTDKRAPASHRCDCHRMCGKDEDGKPTLAEDPKCKVYCHKDHCGCPTSCEST